MYTGYRQLLTGGIRESEEEKMKKKLLVLGLVCVMCVGLWSMSAGATYYTYYYYSEACTAGTIAVFAQRNLTFNSGTSNIMGTYVNVEFVNGPANLPVRTDSNPTGFMPGTDRGLCAYIRELDGSSYDIIRSLSTEFDYEPSTGKYYPSGFTTFAYNPYTVETDGTLELKLQIFFDTYPGDTTNSVPAQFFQYRFRAY